jgi:hypothetical protein
MPGLGDLKREYERSRFPADRRLDLHGEGPRVARERALHWIQSHAHEEPGSELLLVAERVTRPGRPPGAVATEISKLLGELQGKLITDWSPFTPGSFAVKLSTDPRMVPPAPKKPVSNGDTKDIADPALAPTRDIPPELLGFAEQATELRLQREDLSRGLREVIMREIWIEVQAMAMERRLTFGQAMDRILTGETEKMRSG